MAGTDVRYKAADGKAGRILIVRLQPGTDLIKGILQVCQEYEVKNAYIGCCIGSLKSSRFTYGVPDSSVKCGSGFSPEQVFSHPTEFISGQGTICHNEKGEVLIHFHGFLCEKGHIFGGHFEKPGNIVCSTMEIAIREVLGVEMTRPLDPEIDQNSLHPKKISGGSKIRKNERNL